MRTGMLGSTTSITEFGFCVDLLQGFNFKKIEWNQNIVGATESLEGLGSPCCCGD